MNKEDKINFVQRLAFLLNSGITLQESLRMLQSQALKKNKIILKKLLDDVSKGLSLSKGFTNLGVWNSFAIHIVKVGEMSGTLNSNLQYLAEELKKRHALRRKIQTALIYPFFILISALAVGLMMSVYLFPKILPVFKSINGELPFSTKILIFTSDLVSHYWIIILFFVLFIPTIIWFLCKKYYRVRFLFYSFFLYIPLISQIIKYAMIANICRTLGLLQKSGITLSESLAVTGLTLSNPIYKEKLIEVSEAVSRGEKISTHFALYPKIFFPMVSDMTAIGERAGNLSDVFLYISEYYEKEVDEITKNLSSSIEPILMIIIGLSVGFIAVAVISPIYAITQNLHQ
ncbi:MAG: type II secretion system F family protein [Patescibacteria group bacterium]|nr:type II secretion system F family protein [Patescibacteria group bacterium]